MRPILIKNATIINENSRKVYDLLIRDKRIEKIDEDISVDYKCDIINAEKLILIPGLIDDQDKGKKESELKKEYLEIAERRVRLGLLMQEIGNTNKISVNEEEIKKVILQEAKKYPGEENKVLDFYKKNPEALNAIRGPIFEEKVVDLILKESLITEKKVSSEDLFSDPKIEAIKSNKPTKTKVKK